MRGIVDKLLIARPLLIFIFIYVASSTLIFCDHLSRKEFIINIWTENNGLPQNNIQAIVQDLTGYLWIGTESGLARFDGNNFRVFDSDNTPEMTSNDIISLYLDPNGSLLISTYNGGILKYRRGQFSSLNQELGLDPKVTGKLLRDSSGALWIGTKTGLFRFYGGQLSRFIEADGLPNNIITCLAEDHKGIIWIGTYGGGVSSFKDNAFINYSTKDGLASNTIRCMYLDRNETLWIGTYGGGLTGYKDGKFLSFSKESGSSNEMIRAIIEDNSGAIWIGTNGNGLKRFSDGKFLELESAQELPSKFIWVLYEDTEGNLWVGTKGGGLVQLRRSKFMTYTTADGLPHDFIRSVIEDRERNLWVGTNDGLAEITGKNVSTFRNQDGLPSNFIRTIYQDRNGFIWVGTNGGLSRGKDGKWESFTEKNGLSSNLINVLCEDRNGNLLVGTYGGGLDLISDRMIRPYPLNSKLPNKIIFDIYETLDGKLWVGTHKGLACFYQGTSIDFPGKKSFEQDTVLDIYEDGEGTLWIGTYGNGIKMIKNGQVAAFTTKHGLYNDYIYCILEDSESNLWISCNQGIFSLPKVSLENLAKGSISVLDTINYDMSDGLPSNECNGMVQPSAWKTQDDHLLFATVKGLVHIDPLHIYKNPFLPPVVIEGIIIDGRPVNDMNNILLSPKVRNLTISFTALSFASPKKIGFAYKLEGLDKDWIRSPEPKLRTASYSNLPPGRYTFRVKASNSDGVWNEQGASIEFRYRRPPYQNPVFLVIFFPGIAATVLVLKRYLLITIRKGRAGRYKNSKLSEAEARTIASRLIELMEVDRIYLDSELTVEKLAAIMHIPRKQLSQVLNEQFKQNFNSFINTYRIIEAQKLILDPRYRKNKLLVVALDAGFNSKSVFNQAFKKHAGCTPSQFLRMESKKKS